MSGEARAPFGIRRAGPLILSALMSVAPARASEPRGQNVADAFQAV